MPNSSSHSVFALFAVVAPYPGQESDTKILCDGSYAYCYVSARDEEHAINKLRTDLAQRNLRITNIEWCINHDSPAWGEANRGVEDASVMAARNSTGIVYDKVETSP